MIHAIEATIDESGYIRLTEPLPIKGGYRAFIAVLDEPPGNAPETALLSEDSLSADWARPEEDEAWSHLQ
uniref:DUF2281 domain-containing protein n=1 Tax=Candidatus Kentrum sp. FW TaxID=2126338 RepID=A0A450SCL3_9GAMM|nr:MAG: hypothetical protein BECKFW1821B_GA0114236_100646 [Candidatus Kentron sp. FW]